MESNYTLNIYPSAQLDLDKIFAYIYNDLSNPKAAIDLIDAFRKSFNNLRCFPENNPLVNCRLLFYKTRSDICQNLCVL